MSDKSAIEWTDATWNPVTGCTKVSPACANCYIERTPPFRVRGRKFVNGHIPLEFHPDRLDVPLRRKKPTMYFVNSLSDLFHKDVPFEFVAAVFAVMAYCEQHTFQVLTKRPRQMLEFMSWVNAPEGEIRFTELYGSKAGQQIVMPRMQRVDEDIAARFHEQTADGVGLHPCLHNNGVWPPKNVWLGVSVENQHFADERIPLLLQTPASVRFISAEPLLGPLELRPWMPNALWNDLPSWKEPELDWVIVGGESGPSLRPTDPAWVRSIRDQCNAAGVAFFFKQWGGRTPKSGGRELDGRVWDEMPRRDDEAQAVASQHDLYDQSDI